MLEPNKIYHGDCFELMKELPDESVDFILTDPPYGISFLSTRTNNYDKLENDDLDDWLEQIPKWLSEFRRILTPTGVCCCFLGGGGKMATTALFTIEAIKHLKLIQTLVWKKFIGLGWRYRPAYENIIVLSKSEDNYNFYDTSKKCSNVIEGINQKIPKSNPINNYYEHPTQKPVELMIHLLNIHSKEGDLVLDPFLGSGTTAIACIKTNRKFIGMEINKHYYEMAQKRIDAELSQLKLNL